MKKILLIISVFVVFSACGKLEPLNENKKDFTVVSGASLYNGASLQLANELSTTNINLNVTNHWMQQLAATTYADESRYDMTTRAVPGAHMNTMYRLVLMNLKEAARVLENEPLAGIPQAQRDNQLAIVEIMAVLAWSNIVECFGDMPYTEALNFTFPSPVYDDGLTIYKHLIARLDAAIGKMNPSIGGMPTGYDNINGSSAAGTVKWIKFANALKLRMGLMLADVDNTFAKATVETAAPNVFVSGDKVVMNYMLAPPNQNQQYIDFVASGRDDYVITSNLIDAMQPTNPPSDILNVTVTDPRLKFYADPLGDGTYKGGAQGHSNGFSSFSHVDPLNTAANREWIFMDYVETEFLLAEAVERGFAVGGSAEAHYNNAITASIRYWGGSADEAAAYLAQPTVAYSTAVGNWKQKIGTQAWLSYWLRGFVAWNSYRRLDYPRLQAPDGYLQGIDKVPVRLFYPVSEQTLNEVNYTDAAAKIGGDHPLTLLFWDKELY